MQTSKGGFYRLVIALLAMFMIAAACGGGDDALSGSDAAQATASDSGGDDAEEDEGEDEGGGLSQDAVEKAVSGDAEEEEVDADAPTFDRSTLDGIWEEAAYNRQLMIDEITEKVNAGEWGVGDDNVLRGPTGYEIDLNGCPGDWSNTQGVSDSELRLGHTLVQSGNLAAYGNITHGM
ncbi:MAG: hypothetical protein ABGW68_00855, partial [Gammaproteobacteria bacterium]